MSCTTGSDLRSRWLLTLLTAATLLGCGGDGNVVDEEDAPPEFTYICSKSKEREVGPLRTWPYDNPKVPGGQFMLSLHCRKCDKWYPVPPPDKGRGNPLAYRCPKTNGELMVTEPGR
jgi:uncharacterized protein YbaR (Trm112 family)